MNICQAMYRIFERESIDLICSLPCNKFAALIENIPARFSQMHLTREENGIGISAGHYLTGGKPLMLIQTTGLGNSLNALLSLHGSYHLPLPIVASWRGRENDQHESQKPFGKSLPEVLRAFGLPCTVVEKTDELDRISTAIQDSYSRRLPHIVLIDPDIWEANEDRRKPAPFGFRKRATRLSYDEEFGEPVLTRHEALEAMVRFFDEAIVLTTIGRTCSELYDVVDRDLNFYILSAMGQASAIGLGMALNTNRRVCVLDGDGSLLMNPGILTEISVARPKNLTVIVLDNGTYSTTGDQAIPSYDLIDLALVARSFGIASTRRATTRDEIAGSLSVTGDGPHVLHVPIRTGKSRAGSLPLKPVQVRDRFMKAVSAR